MLSIIALESSFGAGPARDQGRGDDDVLRLDVLGNERCLFLLIGVGHFLGVAAGRLRLLELLILDGDELGAERGDLLLHRRPHIRGADNGPEPAGGSDGLQAGNADAHDEDARGRHGPGRGHHHRQGPLEQGRRVDHGLVAGEIGLARQHVHALRTTDARHQLHGEQRRLHSSANARETVRVVIGIDHADQERALLHGLHQRQSRPPHGQHDIGVLDGIGVAFDDAGSGLLVVLVGEMRARAGA